MSQQNKTPWKPGDNKAKTAPGNLAAAQKNLAAGKQLKQEGKEMGARMQKNAPNLPGFANASNQQKLAGHMANAKSTIANAKAGVKANTRTGPTIGAQRAK